MSEDFWSKRRAAVEAETRETEKVQEKSALAEQHAALEDQSDDEILAQLNLPDPDTLAEGDDFRAFMAQAVPDRIRRRALRTLWRSNPVLANVDRLVEYGEDYTDSATVVENLQTAYQVGKGMMKHVEEMARQAAAAEDAADAHDEVPEVLEEEVDTEMETEVAEVSNDDPVEMPFDPDPEAEAFVPAPRRMKFRVEETA